MVLDPNPKTLPPWLANVTPRLLFSPMGSHFVTDHRSKTPVTLTRVTGATGFKALIFRAPLNEDRDGSSTTYAPPVSATDHGPRNGLKPKEKRIDEATNVTFNSAHPLAVFHPLNATDKATNSWEWAGVLAMDPVTAKRENRTLDDRPFLRDVKGRFPVLQASGFYVSQTAINLKSGDPVDPDIYPYGALSAKLRDMGDVDLGDYGLAIRASTGASSPFTYADAGGDKSNSVGESSTKLIKNLFKGGGATAEQICFVVFPQSGPSDKFADPSGAGSTIRGLLKDLRTYENAEEFLEHLALPPGTTELPQTTAERLALSRNSDLHNIALALGEWGHAVANRSAFYQPPVAPPTNKQIF